MRGLVVAGGQAARANHTEPGPDVRFQAAGAEGAGLQGGAGLHRPRPPRAGHRASFAQPGRLDAARRREPGHLPPPRGQHRPGRGGGGDGPVRRLSRPRRGRLHRRDGQAADMPVLLVVDGRAMARSLAALAGGFHAFGPRAPPGWAWPPTEWAAEATPPSWPRSCSRFRR